MILRKLNSEGNQKYLEYVRREKAAKFASAAPLYLLTNEDTSAAIPDSIEVNVSPCATRYDLGFYLVEQCKSANMMAYAGDAGFWNALSLLYFDQLSPKKSDGTRVVREIHNYCLSEFYFHRLRHAVYMTCRLVDEYSESSRFLLSKPLDTRGELIEQLMARQYFMSCRGVIEVASRLYYDRDRKTFKRGAGGRKSRGCIARFVSWLQQLENTYDLYSMAPDDLWQIMPKEFNRFKES